MKGNHVIRDDAFSFCLIACRLEDIKGAYKRLALQYHPDKNRDKKPDKLREMQDEFEKIQEAPNAAVTTLSSHYSRA